MLVFGLGLVIRGIAFYNIHIINPDGALYIYQAKAIAQGQWNLLNGCWLTYVTLYPLLIALAQTMVSDWVLSAQLVSFLFGFAMLIPVYLTLKQFCTRHVALVTTLMIAFTPVFVRYSVDAMRDATYWFFFAASIWAFLSHIPRAHRPLENLWRLLLSSCLALLAMLTRIEALIIYPAACLFILIAQHDRKILRLWVFFLPPLLLAGVGLSFAAFRADINLLQLVRIEDVMQALTAPSDSYRALRHQLNELGGFDAYPLMDEFLSNARHMVWWIALGAIVSNAMEAFFFPFVPFFLVGAVVALKQLNRRSPLLFPVILVALSLILLYAHVIQKWIMTYRFVALLIIPASTLAGLGMDAVIRWIMRVFNMSFGKTVAAIILIILLPGVVKNASPIESDKAVYTEIADRISQSEGGQNPIGIAARPSTVQLWVNFYANVGSDMPVCHDFSIVEPKTMNDLKSSMHEKGMVYFLWEESSWKDCPFGQQGTDFLGDFVELGRWYHKDTGDLILFRRRDTK